MEGHPFHFIDEQTEGMSITEAATLLNLANSTVYRLALTGELAKIPTFERKIILDPKSVEAYKATHVIDTYTSMSQLLQELNISRARLTRLLDEHKIHLPKVKHGEREQFAITDDLKAQIKAILCAQDVYPKTAFYHRVYGICLYQSFKSALNDQIYRVQQDNDGTWGIQTPGAFLPFDIAKERLQLNPMYNLLVKRRTNPLSVTFKLRLTDAHFYNMLDHILSIFGIYNISFQQSEDHWILEVKQGKYPARTALAHEIKQLASYVVDGKIQLVDEVLHVVSHDVIVPLQFKQDTYEQLSARCAAEGLTVEQYIKNLLEKEGF